jgi:hypothetical protein
MVLRRAEKPPIQQTKAQYRNSDYLSRQARLMILLREVLQQAKADRSAAFA